MSHMKRFVAAFVLFVIVADAVAWRVATSRLRTEFTNLVSDMRASGWAVRYRELETGGWPFAAALLVGDVHIEGGDAALPGGLDWSTGWLRLSVGLSNPWRLAISPHGEETLRISHLPAVTFWSDRLQASFPLGGGRPIHAGMLADGLSGGLQNSRRKQDVRIGKMAVQGQAQESHGGVDAAVDFSASSVELPDIGRWPLGDIVKHLSATATMISPPVRGATSREQAQSWHDGLGFVRVHALNVRWGPLTLTGDAQVGLDARLQPAGSGALRVTGYAAALDALASAGVIGPGLAVTYKALLDLMSPAGGSTPLKLPLTLRDSTLSVGQIPLAKLGDVQW